MARECAPSSPQIHSITHTLHDKIHLGTPSAALEEEDFQLFTHTPAVAAHAEKAAELLHVVMVPYPLQGHINPMMQFSKMLIAKHRMRVTFINNKQNHDRILRTHATRSRTDANRSPADSVADSRIHTDDDEHNSRLQLLWLDNGLPPDLDLSDMSGLRELALATPNMKDPFKQLLQSLNQKCPHISCVVFGSFCPWARTVAVELSIPNFCFWTQSASVFSIYYHVPLLDANGFFPYDKKKSLPGSDEDGKADLDGVENPETTDSLVTYIPGVPSLRPSSFPTLLHIDDLSNPYFASIRNQFLVLTECDGIIINSFEDLEKDASQVVQAELPLPVYLVGPLIPSAFLGGSDKNDTSVGASLLQEKNDCINWLDSQKKHSVIYISFGSICNPSSEDLEAIACGMKSSKQPFLWVIRRPTPSSLENVCDILPKGFIEDTKEYGLIIPWAPQMRVLSHPSIGAFLTHCGWNSTLEGLSMGVPMIPLPLFSDQTTNCTYVCDIWKVGMALKRGGNGALNSEAVERVVRVVLHEEEGKEMRKRATKLKEAAREAVQTQGSSSNDIENFIRRMKTHGKSHCRT